MKKKLLYTMLGLMGIIGILFTGATRADTTATLMSGQGFRNVLRNLTYYRYEDCDMCDPDDACSCEEYHGYSVITAIEMADDIPLGVTTRVISDSTSDNEVVAWYDNEKIYYYTEADKIYMNSDSSHMFDGVSLYENLDLNDFDASRVEDMSYMFGGCSKLTSLDVSHFDTSKVTNMEGMFQGCSNLETIYVGDKFVVSQVTNSSYMFDNDTKLIGGNRTKYNSSYIDKEYARIDKPGQPGYFTDKTSITVKIIAGGEQIVKYVAYGDTLTLPQELENLEVNKYILSNSTEVDLENTIITKYTEIYAILSGDAILSPGGIFHQGIVELFGPMYETYGQKIKHIVRTGSIDTSLTAQRGNHQVLSAPYSDNEVVAWYDYANDQTVYYYTPATTIYLNMDSSEMFRDMINLESIDMSGWNTSMVTDMAGMFKNCSSLTSLDLSNWDTSNVRYMSQMFKNCSSLTSLDLSNWNTSSVIYVGSMFYGCSSLKTIRAGKGFLDNASEDDTALPSSWWEPMFGGDSGLVGGSGTVYNSSHQNKTYARIDLPPEEPGYFTLLMKVRFYSDGQIYHIDEYTGFDEEVKKPEDPSKDGAEFGGWYLDSNYEGEPFDFEGSSLQSNLKLYARWIDNNTGGEGGDDQNNDTPNNDSGNNYSGGGGGRRTSENQSRISENESNVSSGTNVRPAELGEDLTGNTQDSPAGASEGQGYTQEFITAYNFAYKNGITTMDTIDKADMQGGLTRIAMAKMLSQYAINVLGKKPANVTVPRFGDVDDKLDSDYDNGVTLAYQLGIMGINMPNNEFRPFDYVTRAEFGTALSRMLYGIADGEEIYYLPHLAKLLAEKIITNNNPELEELRGYVMIMLMRSAKVYKIIFES